MPHSVAVFSYHTLSYGGNELPLPFAIMISLYKNLTAEGIPTMNNQAGPNKNDCIECPYSCGIVELPFLLIKINIPILKQPLQLYFVRTSTSFLNISGLLPKQIKNKQIIPPIKFCKIPQVHWTT